MKQPKAAKQAPASGLVDNDMEKEDVPSSKPPLLNMVKIEIREEMGTESIRIVGADATGRLRCRKSKVGRPTQPPRI